MKNTIDLDVMDYEIILNHGGKIDGLVGSINIDECAKYVIDKLGASLRLAKGVLIVFKMNENRSMKIISTIMNELDKFVNEEADVILGTEIDNTRKEDQTIGFRIIVSGL